MRIIGGKNRSRLLKMVPSEDTRETSDKVRQAVFNSIDYLVVDSKVLDLFAGSGAYGLEALSRGASQVWFNDSKLPAVKTIKENITNLNETEHTIVWQKDYQDALEKIKKDSLKFDLIFLDPPYKLNIYESIINDLKNNIEANGLVVAEMAKERNLDMQLLPEFQLDKERIYGTKKINYIVKKI